MSESTAQQERKRALSSDEPDVHESDLESRRHKRHAMNDSNPDAPQRPLHRRETSDDSKYHYILCSAIPFSSFLLVIIRKLTKCVCYFAPDEHIFIVKMSEIDDEDAPPVTTIRALVATKEAGVIIGKSGKNVKEIRELSGARVNISEMIPGAAERVLTVIGPLDAAAKVRSFTLFSSLEVDFHFMGTGTITDILRLFDFIRRSR